MKVACDTSILVPALWKWHAEHLACVAWLDAARSGRVELVVQSHALAETYAVLTRLPVKPKISPVDAWTVIEQSLLPHATLVDIPASVYCRVLASLSTCGLAGGIVYDALIAAAAESAAVEWLLTNNVSHFETVWPQGRGRIRTPESLFSP